MGGYKNWHLPLGEDASFRVVIAYMRFLGRLINIYGTYPELL